MSRAAPRLCALFLALVGLLAVPSPETRAQDLKKASLIPQWEPQAQFAGYYVALAKGFYRARGVDMTILRGGPKSPPSRLLFDGRATFGTFFLPTAIKLRSDGLPLVNICQIVRRSSLVLIARKDSGIREPKDLHGRRVSMWGPEFRLQPETFFRKHGVTVIPKPQGFTVDLFLRGGVNVVSGMLYNEYHTLINAGLDPDELTVFAMDDHGLSFPEDGIYCTDKTLQTDPELCRAVAQASLEGWKWAFEHPEQALDVVMSHVNAANLPTNRMHQKWMLARMQDIIAPQGVTAPLGSLSRDEYQAVGTAMLQAGLITTIPPYEAFYADLAK
ncbi:ABC transporter substrate-binding protein [Desulfolutivibrio sulfoxidireducens]|uniref:ABC transporter substrate-binding protein n=1 Tax=Desulfolutivibrio sulfoxidireducens TaxID=2773299 RepID=UPI00159D0F1D|nr:ABC transporter substrate-binding protein [Desulfolutivibrio sulfoxidireducens]QLA17188.1 ABC transporter substrate-binding protein [Desulfolutivibrio sulfoxidireducens]